MRREGGPSNGAGTEGEVGRECGLLSICYCSTYAGRRFRRAGRLRSQSLQNAPKNRPKNRTQEGMGGKGDIVSCGIERVLAERGDSNPGFFVSRCDLRACGVRHLLTRIWGFRVVAPGCGCFRVSVPWDGHILVTRPLRGACSGWFLSPATATAGRARRTEAWLKITLVLSTEADSNPGARG